MKLLDNRINHFIAGSLLLRILHIRVTSCVYSFLPSCIHLVSKFTFRFVRVLKPLLFPRYSSVFFHPHGRKCFFKRITKNTRRSRCTKWIIPLVGCFFVFFFFVNCLTRKIEIVRERFSVCLEVSIENKQTNIFFRKTSRNYSIFLTLQFFLTPRAVLFKVVSWVSPSWVCL